MCMSLKIDSSLPHVVAMLPVSLNEDKLGL
jgi:hypothetical protein